MGEILEDKMRRPVRTINMGVGSYNTDNQNAALLRYGDMLESGIVVLTYVSNDIDPTPEQEFDPWSDYSLDDNSPREVLEKIIGKSWIYRLIWHLTPFGSGTDERKLPMSSKGWKQSVDALKGISDYCRSRNIRYIVIMYRMVPVQLENDIARELSVFSEKMSSYYGDALPWFNGRDIRQLVNSRVDGHPNAEGHLVLAQGIVSLLQESVFLRNDKLL